MENNSQTAPTNKTKEYERLFHADLNNYLTSIGLVDKHFPEAPDIEERWAKIGESYMPDGIREFNGYPTAALGWMMYVGMAVAKYWDLDWDLYGKVDDLYRYLRDRIGYDDMDTYISEKVLLLDEKGVGDLRKVIGECASRTYNTLLHLGAEPGSADAFYAFIAALHVMYLMGSAMQLKDMGYHMTKIQ